MPMNIGIDFDDVLIRTNEHLAIWHNEHYGPEYAVKDIDTYDLFKIWQCSEVEMFRRFFEFCEGKEHRRTRTVQGAKAVLAKLRRRGDEMCIITSRPDRVRVQTEYLVHKHFPSLADRLVFTAVAVDGLLVKKPKAEVCRERGVEIMIEDNLDYACNVAGAGIRVLLLNRPWNQSEELSRNIQRVYSWKEIFHELT